MIMKIGITRRQPHGWYPPCSAVGNRKLAKGAAQTGFSNLLCWKGTDGYSSKTTCIKARGNAVEVATGLLLNGKDQRLIDPQELYPSAVYFGLGGSTLPSPFPHPPPEYA
jgi:hypothetical protein